MRELDGLGRAERVTRGTAPDVQVVESNGQYVVLVSLTSTKTSDEDILAYTTAEEGGSVTINPSGLVYRYLVSSALQRDLGWLNTIPREVLEAAAK